MAKISTFTDPFTSVPTGSSSPMYLEPDSSNGQPSGVVTVSGGVLSMGGGTYSDTGYYTSVNSQSSYDLTSSAVFIKVVAGESGTGDGDTGIAVLASNFSDGYNYDITGGNLQVEKTVSDSPTTLHTVAYNATSMAWLKISESGGTITFSTAPDGLTWTSQYTTTTETEGSWHAATSYVQLFYGSNSGGSKPTGTAQFSALNVAPGGGGGGGATVSVPSPPILGMYETSGAFPTPGPGAWPSGPTTNLSATYQAWGQDFPTYGGAFIDECNANGLIPFVELEPWESGSSWNVTPLFSSITGGTWDTWLEGIGTYIAGTGKACILTFAHEMNVSGQYPWSQGDTGSGPGGGALTAAEWIAGWTYVKNKVNSTANGYALWMWACSAYTGGTTISPAAYWPSSALPDMVGIDGYPNTEYGGSLGTFTGQIEPTVSIIRGLGWSKPIFISETNLAQMVASGGESIASFVSDMFTAGISGILEFEDASWGLPQMTSTQWTQYNNAVAEFYGTGAVQASALLSVGIA
jgi:hypothetical protein